MPKNLSERLTTLKTISLTKLRTLGPSPTAGSFNRNFQIDKQGRFAFRFFQILIAIASWYFIGKLDKDLISGKELWPTVRYLWILAVCSPVFSVGLVLQYFISCLAKSWSSVKVLALEFICDFLFFFGWLVCIAHLGITMGTNCPPNSTTECNNFNWVLAWGSFSILFWFAALVWDIKGFLKGIWGWGGERLNDMEMDSEIRRLSRNTARGSRWR